MDTLQAIRSEFEQREAARAERERHALAVGADCPSCGQRPSAAGTLGFTCPSGHVYRGAGLHSLECPDPYDCWCD